MPEIFKYEVTPTYPEGTTGTTFEHADSRLAVEDVLGAFEVGATEVNIRIVKKEEN